MIKNLSLPERELKNFVTRLSGNPNEREVFISLQGGK